MKSESSSLNPYAPSYVPLASRKSNDESGVLEVAASDSNRCGATPWPEIYPVNATQSLHPNEVSPCHYPLDYNVVPAVKFQPPCGSYGTSSHNRNEMSEKQAVDANFDMDMEYLKMACPGLSDQSLNEVYIANRGDLEAAIDMINHLEGCRVESSEAPLPDTLDIGDASEPTSSSTGRFIAHET